MRGRGAISVAAMAAALMLTACAGGAVHQGQDGGVARNHQAAVVNTQLGTEYMRMDDLGQAGEKLERAMAQDPDFHSAHLAYAMLQERLGRDSLAERHYRRAIELRPDDSEAHNNYGIFLCRRDRTVEAEATFRRALENQHYRTPEVAMLNAGLCALRAGDTEGAESWFSRSVEAHPRYAPPLLELAELKLAGGAPGDARLWLHRLVSYFPESPRSLWLCVRIERDLGNRDGAAGCARRLKSGYPDAPETELLRELEDRDR